MTSQRDHASFLYGSNGGFLEELYARYVKDPAAVDASWRDFFDDLGDNGDAGPKESQGPAWSPSWNGEADEILGDGLADRAATHAMEAGVEDVRAATLDSIRALMLIRSYRVRGHLMADLDPLGIEQPEDHPELDPATYGFGEADLDRPIFIDHVLGLETATVREIVAILKRTYCSTIGVEFMHIQYPEQKAWIQERIEGAEKYVEFTPEGKKAIYNKLVEAEGFERFLNVKYTGTKRFGLDGGESLIPAMEAIIKRGGQLGVSEIVLGMPHRGRLNVLANVMAKPYRAIFSEFQGVASNPEDVQGSGDVKYHLGSSSDREFDGNKVHLSLTANPSHLEAVDPVVLGKVRAKQTRRGERMLDEVMAVLMHGDAAFAGQGLVAECFGMSDLRGYRTGGTIHFIVNNQIGFTTAPRFSRSSPYPSDVAKMVQAPIFHVNGDDPEAVTHVAKIATEFRQQFKRDVVIDMFCYRRHGHNESDEPAFTQPLMYRRIAQHPTTRQIYGNRLVQEKLISGAEAEGAVTAFADQLSTEFEAATSYKPNKADWLDGVWSGLAVASGDERRGVTAVARAKLEKIGRKLCEVPEDFNLHRGVRRFVNERAKSIEAGTSINWALAEALAFGTLVEEGYPVRLSGQDSGRGTFTQRHAVLVDQDTEERYIPLANISDIQGQFEVIDSMLSENAVLGLEYGFSLAEPNALVLWEAQFGDFANGAQVIIDQFIAPGELKWLRMSGLVLLLPHGFEGQGPEHSSARLERYLQLCAEDNMQVVNCTTPANHFHVLRRQLHRNFRKPLICMTPKSLLRHKAAVSTLDEMATGSTFHRVLYDNQVLCEDKEVKRIVLCSGKVYYDLKDERDKRGDATTFFLRLEQLYPFPTKALKEEIRRFKNVEDIVWCQEEPANMGAWFFVRDPIEAVLEAAACPVRKIRYAGRKAAASPATGIFKTHVKEQAALVDTALSAPQ